MQLQPTAKFVSATALVSAIGLSLGIGRASGAEVALVESVSGRIVAFAAGKPTLLDAARCGQRGNPIGPAGEQRAADMPLKMRQFLTLRGPMRASIRSTAWQLKIAKRSSPLPDRAARLPHRPIPAEL